MMKKEEDKIVFSDVLEGMTSISALLNSSEKYNDRTVQNVWIDVSKKKSKAAQIGFLTAKAKERGFAVTFVTEEQIREAAVGNTHGVFLAFCSPRTISPITLHDILPNGFYVYLEGIEDPYNFGYALRSLYAAGVHGVLLPPRNWMQAAGTVARASAGASELLPMFLASSAEDCVSLFQQRGYTILCAGIRNSVSVFEESFPLPVLLVVGGEKRRISRTLLDRADKIVRIDYGRKFPGSLSAASAATVLGFEIFRQNRAVLTKEGTCD